MNKWSRRLLSSFAIVAASIAVQPLAQTSAKAEPTTAPSDAAVIQATDADAIAQRAGSDVVIEGKVASAEWSKSGKVMDIKFEGVSDDKGFAAVVFDRNREALNGAFGGNLAQSLAGAKVRIKGKLRPYNGKVERMKGRIELTISKPDQITILEPGTGAPATQPSH
jgi:hypothetical protein